MLSKYIPNKEKNIHKLKKINVNTKNFQLKSYKQLINDLIIKTLVLNDFITVIS